MFVRCYATNVPFCFFSEALVAPNVTVIETDETEITVSWENINIPVDQWTVRVFPEGRNQYVEVSIKNLCEDFFHISLI